MLPKIKEYVLVLLLAPMKLIRFYHTGKQDTDFDFECLKKGGPVRVKENSTVLVWGVERNFSIEK